MKADNQTQSRTGRPAEVVARASESPSTTNDYEADLISRVQRVCAGRTCAEVSKMTQTNHETVRRYMRGLSVPPPEFLARLCQALGVSANWMLLGTELPGESKQGPSHSGWRDDDI
jgi:transcriptional regulator with XRE-family HTH domain